MRYGFTTGSCAAAAAKAAAYMLLTGREKTEITIETPKGIPYTAQIRNICRKEQEVSCAVEKDGGDDPDITTGALICAKVSFAEITDRKAREDTDSSESSFLLFERLFIILRSCPKTIPELSLSNTN